MKTLSVRLERLEETVTLHACQTPDDLQALQRWMAARSGRLLGLDTESTGLNLWEPDWRLRTVQIADPHEAWVIPADLTPDTLRGLLTAHPRWLAHNAAFDIHALTRGLEVVWPETPVAVRDAMLLIQHVEPRTTIAEADLLPVTRLSAGLKDTSHRHLTATLAETEQALHGWFRALAPAGHTSPAAARRWGFRYAPADADTFLRYAGLDPLVTVRVWEHLLPQLAPTQRQVLAADVRLAWTVARMTGRGMRVDVPYAHRLASQLAAAVTAQQPVLQRHRVSSASDAAGIRAAFTRLGAHTSRTTPKGAPSYDQTALAELAVRDDAAGELARAVQTARRATKFRSTYVEPLLTAARTGGRVHPSVRVYGATTGRMAASDPPVQQLPKQDPRVRAAFVADPGHVLISCDFGQVEARVIAALSGDAAFRRALADGRDVHADTAAHVWGTEAGGQHRGLAKAAFFAWCYGASVRKLASMLGLDAAGAQRMIDYWKQSYPRVHRLASRLARQPAVVLLSGRRLPLWDRHRTDQHGAVVPIVGKRSRVGLNYLVQGQARELLARAVLRLTAAGWSWALWGLVHDEILLHVPEAQVSEAMAAVRDAMECTFWGVQIVADPVVLGGRWAQPPNDLLPTDNEEDAA